MRDEVVAHQAARDVAEPDVDPRMRACSLRILLDALGYCAFAGRTADVVAIDAQVAALLE